MAKFNTKPVGEKVVNEEGAPAYKMGVENELYTRVASCLFGEPKFYDAEGKGDAEIINLVGKVAKKNPEFVLKLAAFARNELYLRSVPLVLLTEAAKYEESRKFVRQYAPAVLRRADELTEAIAYWVAKNGSIGDAKPEGSLPASLKKGIADSFKFFDEYQFAKYDRDGAVKLRDVVRIVHPKPRNSQEAALFKRIIDRQLKEPETWEVVISTGGSTKENWQKVLPKMGFMARIRNLRNLIQKSVDITSVIEMLTDETQVRKSKQLPFRFYSAYRELANEPQAGEARDALATALELSVANVPRLPGTTFIVGDNSGSMGAPISEKSTVSRQEVSSLLASMGQYISDKAYAGVFGERFAFVPLSKKDSILTNMARLCGTNVGHSTNAWTAMVGLGDIYVDRIMVFSDMQCYDSISHGAVYHGHPQSLAGQLAEYRKRVNPHCFMYSFDLAGYGTSQFSEHDKHTALIGGWSDKVFQFIQLFEEGGKVLDRIKAYVPPAPKATEEE